MSKQINLAGQAAKRSESLLKGNPEYHNQNLSPRTTGCATMRDPKQNQSSRQAYSMHPPANRMLFSLHSPPWPLTPINSDAAASMQPGTGCLTGWRSVPKVALVGSSKRTALATPKTSPVWGDFSHPQESSPPAEALAESGQKDNQKAVYAKRSCSNGPFHAVLDWFGWPARPSVSVFALCLGSPQSLAIRSVTALLQQALPCQPASHRQSLAATESSQMYTTLMLKSVHMRRIFRCNPPVASREG